MAVLTVEPDARTSLHSTANAEDFVLYVRGHLKVDLAGLLLLSQEEARLNVAFGLKAAAVHRVEVPGLAGGPQAEKRLRPADGNASRGVH